MIIGINGKKKILLEGTALEKIKVLQYVVVLIDNKGLQERENK